MQDNNKKIIKIRNSLYIYNNINYYEFYYKNCPNIFNRDELYHMLYVGNRYNRIDFINDLLKYSIDIIATMELYDFLGFRPIYSELIIRSICEYNYIKELYKDE